MFVLLNVKQNSPVALLLQGYLHKIITNWTHHFGAINSMKDKKGKSKKISIRIGCEYLFELLKDDMLFSKCFNYRLI